MLFSLSQKKKTLFARTQQIERERERETRTLLGLKQSSSRQKEQNKRDAATWLSTTQQKKHHKAKQKSLSRSVYCKCVLRLSQIGRDGIGVRGGGGGKEEEETTYFSTRSVRPFICCLFAETTFSSSSRYVSIQIAKGALRSWRTPR